MTETNAPIRDEGGKSQTTVGNYFISNYPPYSFWTAEQIPKLSEVLDRESPQDKPFGLYIHLPFCRQRCDFCYFKVYTDKNARDIARYIDAVLEEMAMMARASFLEGRQLDFVYFGGGTPSYLSVKQLESLFGGLQNHFSWDQAREVTFECEPGTLQEAKIEALHKMGVTRLSLGVENFDPEILELNNRAHRAKEIYRAYGFARETGFSQINIDLIAGMVGETEENWKRCIEETVRLAPESVTVYQMEVPYNTTIYRRMKDGGKEVAPVADWETKRRWTAEAFKALEAEGYLIGSAYTAKKDASVQFVYRDGLFTGVDLVSLGVSSFSHLGGVHYQNEHRMEEYLDKVEGGTLPTHRAYELNDDERLVREFVLQLKLGELSVVAFKQKFGLDVRSRFKEPLGVLVEQGWLIVEEEYIRVTRDGLLRIDILLPEFFLDQHRHARYA